MDITLSRPFAANSKVDETDVRQMKRVLNRLGYYQPLPQTGITGIADTAIFKALKSFQEDYNLLVTGVVKPNDETAKELHKQSSKPGASKYIWHTVGDDKVREEHRDLDGTLRDWSESPTPGEEPNCRCWAEPIEPGLNAVYPELILFPFLKIGRGAGILASRIFKIIKAGRTVTRNEKLTAHGKLRLEQRKISQVEIEKAMKTAKETGQVRTKIGKYGTPQNVYTGSNGVTVVEETTGRNAGKIITSWRH